MKKAMLKFWFQDVKVRFFELICTYESETVAVVDMSAYRLHRNSEYKSSFSMGEPPPLAADVICERSLMSFCRYLSYYYHEI